MHWTYQTLLPGAARQTAGGAPLNFQAAAGSFACDGYASSGLRALRLLAEPAFIFVSGPAIGLAANRRIATGQGLLSLSGSAAGFANTPILTASRGAFSTSGPSAFFKIMHKLTPETGAILLSGQSAAISPPAIAFNASAAEIAVSSSGANFTRRFRAQAERGVVSVSGGDVTARTGRATGISGLQISFSIGL